ncbi:MAG: hypothetical protein QM844_10740, partial [Planctomycetota bacterium]|nr:hypothetical protein [Planctomycetota bacterium]
MPWTRRRFVAQAAAATFLGLPAGFRRRSAYAAGPAGPRSPLRKIHLDDARAFGEVKHLFANDYPGMKLSLIEVDGQRALGADHGGMKVFWVYGGAGVVFLPEGYRTQEGGSQPLPAEYKTESIDPAFAGLLRRLKAGISSVSARAAGHVEAILNRWQGGVFHGDFAVELWNLEHIERPWADDERVEADLVALFGFYRNVGHSTKLAGGHEPIRPGDQLIACGGEEIAVRGRFRCLAVEKIDRKTSHISTARRLRYLVDTAGGCSFDFDPFRRLPLTWYLDSPGQRGDGVNFVNSHVVNVPSELSSTHFHPPKPKIGGLPQTEIYLVLDPRSCGLETKGRKAAVRVFPDLRDLRRSEQHPLRPGEGVYIPPGVGHRGLDGCVYVLSVPGCT